MNNIKTFDSFVNELFGARRDTKTKQNLANIKEISDKQKEAEPEAKLAKYKKMRLDMISDLEKSLETEDYCDGCDRVKSKCICDKVEESRKKRKKKPHNTIDNINKMIEKQKEEKEIEPAATKNEYKEKKEEIEKEEEKAERKKKKEQEKYLGENIKSFEDFE